MTREDLEIKAQTQRLEPVRRSLALIVFVHVVFAALVWWWVEYRSMTTPERPSADQLTWMSPTDINASLLPKAVVVEKVEPPPAPTPPPTPTPEPPATPKAKVLPKAILVSPPPSSTNPPTTPQANTSSGSRFISVSATANTRFAGMEAINEAIHDAFLTSWNAPDGTKVSADQRTVTVDLAILRDGTVHSFQLAEPSGDETLRTSVLDAANRLTTISKSLPDDFQGERYSVKVTCYVE
jgi:hypothetical protein